MWTRKPCVIGGTAPPDDWLILYCGRDCGRVYLTPVASPDRLSVWRWSAWCLPGSQGEARTLADGCEAVRRAVIAAGGRMGGDRADLFG